MYKNQENGFEMTILLKTSILSKKTIDFWRFIII